MSNRRFTRRLVLAGAGASLEPGAGLAQPVRGRRIVTLSAGSLAAGGANWRAFREAMRTLGYGEDELGIESRWADGHNETSAPVAVEPDYRQVIGRRAVPVEAKFGSSKRSVSWR
jgi:hypothetical protein